jgi:dihydroorotase-like cyclic amidohydrolase
MEIQTAQEKDWPVEASKNGMAQIGNLFLKSVREKVQERRLLAKQAVKISAAQPGRRSSSIFNLVQARNLGLHQVVRKKGQMRKNKCRRYQKSV